MMAGDWLQGPYVRAASPTGTTGGTSEAFGFGSSLVFGTIAGTLVDRHGRRFGAMMYVVTYALSCVTKHWSNYGVLMVGRLLGGVATSLLFSTFESWLVGEHFKRGYEDSWLSEIFSKAVFLGNGLTAIASGLRQRPGGLLEGKVALFDAIVVLTIGGGVIICTWTENYGDSQGKKSVMESFNAAMGEIKKDRKVLLLGIIQPLFEASMYTFVFMWTPAISPNDEPIPHGVIFAVFMLASMVGSSIAGKLLSDDKVPVESYMQYVFVVAAMSLFVPSIISHTSLSEQAADSEGLLSFTGQIVVFAFCVFEACVGLFWPSIMKMRSAYVPEESRATIINFQDPTQPLRVHRAVQRVPVLHGNLLGNVLRFPRARGLLPARPAQDGSGRQGRVHLRRGQERKRVIGWWMDGWFLPPGSLGFPHRRGETKGTHYLCITFTSKGRDAVGAGHANGLM